MTTQADLIKQAKHAYIISLNEPRDGMSAHRYAIYVDGKDNQLSILWPSDCNLGKGFKDKLPYQKYTTKKMYPAFHFALSGCGYDKTHALACDSLREINPNIIVERLQGYSPSRVSM